MDSTPGSSSANSMPNALPPLKRKRPTLLEQIRLSRSQIVQKRPKREQIIHETTIQMEEFIRDQQLPAAPFDVVETGHLLHSMWRNAQDKKVLDITLGDIGDEEGIAEANLALINTYGDAQADLLRLTRRATVYDFTPNLTIPRIGTILTFSHTTGHKYYSRRMLPSFNTNLRFTIPYPSVPLNRLQEANDIPPEHENPQADGDTEAIALPTDSCPQSSTPATIANAMSKSALSNAGSYPQSDANPLSCSALSKVSAMLPNTAHKAGSDALPDAPRA